MTRADAATRVDPAAAPAGVASTGARQVPKRVTTPAARVRPRWRGIASIAAALAVVLVLGVAAVVDGAAPVPRGTTVLGIDIGGRTEAEAAAALVAGLGDRLAEPVPATVDGTPVSVDPTAVGLDLDAEATAAAAASGWPNPFRVLFGLTHSVDPVIRIDEGRLEASLRDRVGEIAGAVTPAAITYDGLTPVAQYGAPGRGLDVSAAAAALRAGWLRADQPIALPLTEQHPTPPAEVDRLLAEFARPAVAEPVTVTTDRGEFTIEPAAIAASLVMVGKADATLTPAIDEAKLREAIDDELEKVELEPETATVKDDNGNERIVASSAGLRVDLERLSQDLIPELPRPAPRTLAAELVRTRPAATESDLAAQGIVERISSFTTYFQPGQSRVKNIKLIADEVDGAIVKPGEVFSLNGHTGERSYAQGYVDAPVIQGGRLVNGVGGGVSQFTTALFNAMFYAGLEDVFHKPHSYYYSRYPAVIESTIFYPSLDMKFRNDSPHSVLIDTSYTDSSLTVSFWGTKRYDISAEWGPRRNITYPPTIELSGPGCIATSGINGFTQDAWRIFKVDGKEIKREKFTHRYLAQPNFVCVAKKPSEDEPSNGDQSGGGGSGAAESGGGEPSGGADIASVPAEAGDLARS